MGKYLKVMFGTTSGADKNLEYKIGKINTADKWNPNSDNPREMGGFNFSTEDKIIRWLHRGDTIYDVEVPEDAELIDIVESATPHGVFRSNKIIITNPRKVTDEMALDFYKKSDIPEEAYYKSLAAVSVMGYKNTALAIFKDKVNINNIEKVLEEWNDFMSKGERKNSSEIVDIISNLLLEVKSDLLISINVDKEPKIER